MLRKGLKEIGLVKRDGSDPYNELNPTSIGLSELHWKHKIILFIIKLMLVSKVIIKN